MKDNVFVKTKMGAFAQKAENRFADFASRLAETIDEIQDRTPKFCKVFAVNFKRAVQGCISLAHDALNFAVKMSIILIAMITLYNFAQANPELATQINDAALNIFNTVRESAIKTYEYFEEIVLAPLRLFGLFN